MEGVRTRAVVGIGVAISVIPCGLVFCAVPCVGLTGGVGDGVVCAVMDS